MAWPSPAVAGPAVANATYCDPGLLDLGEKYGRTYFSRNKNMYIAHGPVPAAGWAMYIFFHRAGRAGPMYIFSFHRQGAGWGGVQIFFSPAGGWAGPIAFWEARPWKFRLVKKGVPEMDPFWGGRNGENTRKTKAFGSFSALRGGHFRIPLFGQGPPEFNLI